MDESKDRMHIKSYSFTKIILKFIIFSILSFKFSDPSEESNSIAPTIFSKTTEMKNYDENCLDGLRALEYSKLLSVLNINTLSLELEAKHLIQNKGNWTLV